MRAVHGSFHLKTGRLERPRNTFSGKEQNSLKGIEKNRKRPSSKPFFSYLFHKPVLNDEDFSDCTDKGSDTSLCTDVDILSSKEFCLNEEDFSDCADKGSDTLLGTDVDILSSKEFCLAEEGFSGLAQRDADVSVFYATYDNEIKAAVDLIEERDSKSSQLCGEYADAILISYAYLETILKTDVLSLDTQLLNRSLKKTNNYIVSAKGLAVGKHESWVDIYVRNLGLSYDQQFLCQVYYRQYKACYEHFLRGQAVFF